MPYVSNAYGTFPSRGTIAVDRPGIVGAGTLNFREYWEFQNQSTNPVYVEIEIDDPNGNWTFDDDTTLKQLGEVAGGTTKAYTLYFKRPEPAGDVEETFTLKIRVYQDSGYTTLQYEFPYPVDVYIVDFKNNSNWTVHQEWNFDDGTPQGWSGGTVSDRFSIEAGGYAYANINNRSSSSGGWTGTYTNTLSGYTLPTGSVVLFVGYYAVYMTKDGNYIKDFKVLFGSDVVLDLPGIFISKGSGDPQARGWYQVGINLTDYAGQTGDLKIQHAMRANPYSVSEIHFDNLMLVYKP